MKNDRDNRSSSNNLMAFVPNAHLYETTEAPYMWNISSVAIVDDKTVFAGWCLPHDGLLDNTHILINGRAFEPLRSTAQGVYAEKYPWHPNAAYSQFYLAVPHDVFDIRKEKEISVSCHPKNGNTPKAKFTLDFLVSDLSYEMPPPDVAARIGVEDRLQYVMYGRAIFRGFQRALTKNFNTSFADYQTILDWGCGSARIARHVAPSLKPGSTLIGFDIDEFAVNWSNSNVGPHFHVCATKPPLDVKSGSVDLAYAYSVFTHLAADNMKAWVEEMARVLKPNGIGLFTILSENAMITLAPNMDPVALKAWKESGIYDSAHNSQLETIGVSGDYYRNVWFKKSYLNEAFGKHFKIVDYVDTFHFYQDLLVVQRL